jgi:hypothetical protein
MRFLQPDLRQNDRAEIRRRNVCGVSSVFHFFLFTHHQNRSAPRNVIGAIVTAARRCFGIDDPCPSVVHRHVAWQGVAS